MSVLFLARGLTLYPDADEREAFKGERGAQFEKLAGIIRIIKAEERREREILAE